MMNLQNQVTLTNWPARKFNKAHTLVLYLHQKLFQRTQFHENLLLDTKLLTSSLTLLAVARCHLLEGYRGMQTAQAYLLLSANLEVHLEKSPHKQKEHLVFENKDQPNQSEHGFRKAAAPHQAISPRLESQERCLYHSVVTAFGLSVYCS